MKQCCQQFQSVHQRRELVAELAREATLCKDLTRGRLYKWAKVSKKLQVEPEELRGTEAD